MSVCLQMCACVCVGCRSSVGDEKVGVNINNEELKCQRRSEGCEMGRTVCVCGGVPSVLVPGVIITQSNTLLTHFSALTLHLFAILEEPSGGG